MSSAFKKALNSGKFVVTCEVAPPKGHQSGKNDAPCRAAEGQGGCHECDRPSEFGHAVSVPGRGLLVKEMGGEPILQMTCRDRNRLALQADLLFAASRGINNVLCLTGDSVMLGDHKEAKGVFDLDSSQLVATIRRLEKGKDLAGNELDGGVLFCAGAIVTPGGQPHRTAAHQVRKKN